MLFLDWILRKNLRKQILKGLYYQIVSENTPIFCTELIPYIDFLNTPHPWVNLWLMVFRHFPRVPHCSVVVNAVVKIKHANHYTICPSIFRDSFSPSFLAFVLSSGKIFIGVVFVIFSTLGFQEWYGFSSLMF